MGMLMNIVIGIIGATIASAILSFFGIVLGGWIGYLIAGFIGVCPVDLDRPSNTGDSPASSVIPDETTVLALDRHVDLGGHCRRHSDYVRSAGCFITPASPRAWAACRAARRPRGA